MDNQTKLFFAALFIGFSIGWLYDIFRVLRVAVKHADFLTQLEDIIYWVVASLGMFYFMLQINNGEIRVYIVTAAVLGMIAYFFTVSRIFMKMSVFIVETAKKIIFTAIEIAAFPIRLFIRILAIPLKFLKKKMKPAKKHLQNASMYVKIRKSKMKKNLSIIFKKV